MMVNDAPRGQEQPIVRLLMGLAPLLQKPYDPKRMSAFLDAHMDDMPTSVYLALKRDAKMQRGLYDFASGMMKAEEGKYNAQRGYAFSHRNEFERTRAHGIRRIPAQESYALLAQGESSPLRRQPPGDSLKYVH